MSRIPCHNHVSVPKTCKVRRLSQRTWPHPPRRNPHTRVIAQLLELAGPESSVFATSCRPWSSATFIGSRHDIVISFRGDHQLVNASHFSDILPESEFTITGHIVADACVDAMEQNKVGRNDERPETHLHLSILTIEDW